MGTTLARPRCMLRVRLGATPVFDCCWALAVRRQNFWIARAGQRLMPLRVLSYQRQLSDCSGNMVVGKLLALVVNDMARQLRKLQSARCVLVRKRPALPPIGGRGVRCIRSCVEDLCPDMRRSLLRKSLVAGSPENRTTEHSVMASRNGSTESLRLSAKVALRR